MNMGVYEVYSLLPQSKCCNLIGRCIKVLRYRDHDNLRCQDDIS